MTAQDRASELCDDLAAEQSDLAGIVAGLTDDGWSRATPADGWDVRDQISHLAFFDEAAHVAVSDPDRFAAERPSDIEVLEALVASATEKGRKMSGEDVMAWWDAARVALVAELRRTPPGSRVPWYGPSMSIASFATARLMETWAHGQDVVDALGARRTPTDRLRHIAHLGVLTRENSFRVRSLECPSEPVLVELRSPSGAVWTWGDTAANEAVSGTALDFCLVVTQRRHVADTDLEVHGDGARRWMSFAQAFAGSAGGGRRMGQFRS